MEVRVVPTPLFSKDFTVENIRLAFFEPPQSFCGSFQGQHLLILAGLLALQGPVFRLPLQGPFHALGHLSFCWETAVNVELIGEYFVPVNLLDGSFFHHLGLEHKALAGT